MPLPPPLDGGRPRRPSRGGSAATARRCRRRARRTAARSAGHDQLARRGRAPRGSVAVTRPTSGVGARSPGAIAPRGRVTPLRTAPSIVAGHPVSVHAPARYRPATRARPGAAARRCRALPERGALLARHEEQLDAGGPRLAGRAARAPATNCERSSSRGLADVRVGAPTARPRGTGPARARPTRVRSNTHCTGVPTPAANGEVGHPPVVDDVHVDDRGRAEVAAARARRQRARRAAARRRRRAARRARPRRRRRRRRRSDDRRRRPARGSIRSTRVRVAHVDAGALRARRAAGRRAAAAAGPGVADVAGVGRSSSPVWNTLAASASDASAAGRFTVGSAIRFQSASIGAPATGRASASHAPKVRRSSAGSSRSSRRSASGPRARSRRGRGARGAGSARATGAGAAGAGSRRALDAARRGPPGETTGMSRPALQLGQPVGADALEEARGTRCSSAGRRAGRCRTRARRGGTTTSRRRAAACASSSVTSAPASAQSSAAAMPARPPPTTTTCVIGADRRRGCGPRPSPSPRSGSDTRPRAPRRVAARCGRAAAGRSRPWRRRRRALRRSSSGSSSRPRSNQRCARSASKRISSASAGRRAPTTVAAEPLEVLAGR